ncbi:4Fe-4S binding protein [Pseudomonas japonica]|uniref:Ferredoxin--NADP+ reductase n=1 Tax=Pseudomonas japonica TaxID=256466 RepID=A0A239E577_9PSED|nr:4Fe-4S binding protein [Pseudomonas japonica]SNS39448.1 ferredoxin--NADP+ reductase [Pseudomonas japonica]
MPHVITQNCCNDASCVSACPVNCIHPTPEESAYATAEMLYIDPDACVDCGQCVNACPVEAIVPDDRLDAASKPYLELNRQFFADPGRKLYSAAPYKRPEARIDVDERGPLRVAIVGSGPSGSFAAQELLSHSGIRAEVHLFERLPTPWGLVRFGVAPDHQKTKLMTELFERTAGLDGLQFHLNVTVGEHVTHDELLAHHHAVIYTVGASNDRKLNIPGEELPGSHSATDFVAWYNGHPDFADRHFDLSAERAVVVGNGNVALDVARVLASDIDYLARTDIADHALEALSKSRIKEVVVLGRRGPAQAAFTTPELLGLLDHGFHVSVDAKAAPQADLPAIAALKEAILARLAGRPRRQGVKHLVLRFLGSPTEILGENRVSALRIEQNELVIDDRGRSRAQATGKAEAIACGLVLRSIGYQGKKLPGLPIDEATGTLPNDRGRVIDPATGIALQGIYTAGWIKRGPSGVIGTNKKCAAETVRGLLEDFAAGRLTAPRHGSDELRALIALRQPLAVNYAGWKAIDLYERDLARPRNRPRVKLTAVSEMLEVAHGGRTNE